MNEVEPTPTPAKEAFVPDLGDDEGVSESKSNIIEE